MNVLRIEDISFPKQLFIDGGFVDSAGGETFPVVYPATGEEICRVPWARQGTSTGRFERRGGWWMRVAGRT